MSNPRTVSQNVAERIGLGNPTTGNPTMSASPEQIPPAFA